MRIMALTRYFPPEIGTASHLFFELCESLVQRGHQVTAVTGMPWYNLDQVEPKYQNRPCLTEQLNGIQVIRVADLPMPSHEWRVKVGHFSTPLTLALGGLMAEPPEAIIFYSPPLLLGLTAHFLARRWNIPFVMNLQDLYPLCLVDYGYPQAFISFLEKMELFIYKKSEFIIVHSQGNGDYLINFKSQSLEKVKVIHNWVDTDFITPGPKDNLFSVTHGLGNDFIVSFAGTMGAGQGLKFVIDTAWLLKEYQDIKFLMVGGGMEKHLLAEEVEKKQLDNVIFLPMQPKEVYPDILRSSDICLSTLKRTLSAPVVPSKILSIMAAGRPVLASMPLHGDAPKLIEAAKCGLCIGPEDPQALADAILKLYHDPPLRESFGNNGRRYAESHLSREACISKFEALMQEAISQYHDQRAMSR
jgi:colanic acid biosynthesis glycosyl transferase WcaI